MFSAGERPVEVYLTISCTRATTNFAYGVSYY